jgi:hypothetical protein
VFLFHPAAGLGLLGSSLLGQPHRPPSAAGHLAAVPAARLGSTGGAAPALQAVQRFLELQQQEQEAQQAWLANGHGPHVRGGVAPSPFVAASGAVPPGSPALGGGGGPLGSGPGGGLSPAPTLAQTGSAPSGSLPSTALPPTHGSGSGWVPQPPPPGPRGAPLLAPAAGPAAAPPPGWPPAEVEAEAPTELSSLHPLLRHLLIAQAKAAAATGGGPSSGGGTDGSVGPATASPGRTDGAAAAGPAGGRGEDRESLGGVAAPQGLAAQPLDMGGLCWLKSSTPPLPGEWRARAAVAACSPVTLLAHVACANANRRWCAAVVA